MLVEKSKMRRLFWTIFLIFDLLFAFDSFFIEPNILIVSHEDFDLLHANDGSRIKIAFISDIHIGAQRAGYLSDVVQKINEEKPDIVLIGGDSIDGSESEFGLLSPLKDLKPSYGTYAVLGNHDYGVWGCSVGSELADKLEDRLKRMNITVLRNENEKIDIRGGRFALIGLDDHWVCRDDYEKASEGTNSLPKVILIHNTLSVKKTDGDALVLAGHTHCGQVRIPYLTEVIMGPGFGKNLGGRMSIDGHEEYVTCGITSGGVRFLSNPEISVIYLR